MTRAGGQRPRSVRVTGWGMYAPERRLTNADLERVVDTNDEWIVQRTGIRERRVAAANETTATLSAIAGKRAIAVAGLEPDDIDVILVATLTPDYWMPSTGALVKEAIGNTTAAAMDVMAACSGFVYAYSAADAYLRARRGHPVVRRERGDQDHVDVVRLEAGDGNRPLAGDR
jgi:3-oxoacyl-[acyl-carrier-protein] synthase III